MKLQLSAIQPPMPVNSGALYLEDSLDPCAGVADCISTLPLDWTDEIEQSRRQADMPSPTGENVVEEPPTWRDPWEREDSGTDNPNDPEPPGGGEDPGGEDPGGEDPGGEDPEDPPSGPRDKSTNQPINDTTEHLFELPIEVDDVYNIYAGAAVCAVGLSNPQSLLKYKVEDETGYYHNGPTGGLSANTKWNNVEIVFAVRLVPKDGVSGPYEEREISISFDNGEQQTLYANSVYTSYIVLPQPVTLSTDDMLAVRVAIYGDAQTEPPTLPGAVPFSKTTAHTLSATQFVDGVYNFATTIKNCPFTTHAPENGYCSNHDWQKNESQSNGGLWAGTATLTDNN